MANPYHHALSSAKHYGGQWQDYISIHCWLDQSKGLLADARHRALRHYAESIEVCEAVFGPTILLENGVAVPVRRICEQHMTEDFGFMPTAATWIKLLPVESWMSRGSSSPSPARVPGARPPNVINLTSTNRTTEHTQRDSQPQPRQQYREWPSSRQHAVSSARKHGGEPEDYIPIHEWFDHTTHILGPADVRHRALRHHAQGIFTCEEVFGVVFTRPSDGRVLPTRWIGETHVLEDLGCIPTAVRWLELLPLQPWMARGARRLSEELAPLAAPEYEKSSPGNQGNQGNQPDAEEGNLGNLPSTQAA